MEEITDTTSRLREILDEAVADNPAQGVLLSGGLDTSIVALLAKGHVKGLKAFTVSLEGFDEDLVYAEKVARCLDLDHRVYLFTESEALEAAAKAIEVLHSGEYQDEVPDFVRESATPDTSEAVGLSTFAPLYLAMRFAKGEVDSIYTGDGADELFIGYNSLVGFIDEIASSDDEFSRSILKGLGDELSLRGYDLRYPYVLGSSLGLKVKTPFLTPSVVEYARSIPLIYKVRREKGVAWGKWILRKAFEDRLPPEIVWRKKTPIDYGTGAIRVFQGLL